MAKFTICSWNNTNPQEFGTYEAALEAAKARQLAEGALVKIRDNQTERMQVTTQYGLSAWHDDGHLSEKEEIADACDEIEDDLLSIPAEG